MPGRLRVSRLPVAVEYHKATDAVDLGLDGEALGIGDRGLESDQPVVGDELGQDVRDGGHGGIVNNGVTDGGCIVLICVQDAGG
jgi:hypothetical protein